MGVVDIEVDKVADMVVKIPIEYFTDVGVGDWGGGHGG